MPPKSNPNGFAGEPTITAIDTTIAKTMPTITNRLFISKVVNA